MKKDCTYCGEAFEEKFISYDLWGDEICNDCRDYEENGGHFYLCEECGKTTKEEDFENVENNNYFDCDYVCNNCAEDYLEMTQKEDTEASMMPGRI